MFYVTISILVYNRHVLCTISRRGGLRGEALRGGERGRRGEAVNHDYY